MPDLILPRRKFLVGLASLVAAPAIVRAASLMPVKRVPLRGWVTLTYVIENKIPPYQELAYSDVGIERIAKAMAEFDDVVLTPSLQRVYEALIRNNVIRALEKNSELAGAVED